MIACRIKEGKDGKGKGGEKRNKGKKWKKDTVSSKNRKHLLLTAFQHWLRE